MCDNTHNFRMIEETMLEIKSDCWQSLDCVDWVDEIFSAIFSQYQGVKCFKYSQMSQNTDNHMFSDVDSDRTAQVLGIYDVFCYSESGILFPINLGIILEFSRMLHFMWNIVDKDISKL